jgi:hypothetical protein
MGLRLQQAPQRRLNLVADNRFGPPPIGLGARQPSSRNAAIHRGATNHEPLGHLISRFPSFNRHKHTFTQVCRIRSRQSIPPPHHIGTGVPPYTRFAVGIGAEVPLHAKAGVPSIVDRTSRRPGCSALRARRPTGWIAVGTPITGCPPHRTVRAGFPHTAPTLGV